MNAPKLLESPPELPVLEARLAELGAERQDVQDELRRISVDTWEKSQRDVDPLDLAAERLASGVVEVTSRTVAPEQTGVLRRRLELLQAAEFKVRQKIHELRDMHNGRVARSFRPAHRAAARRIHKALIELVAANIAEEELCARVPGGKLRSANFPNVGKFGPNGGPAGFWRAWAQREGLIDKDDDQALPAAAY